MRRPMFALSVALLGLLALDPAPVLARGGARSAAQRYDRPHNCLARFKRAFMRNDRAAEWGTLSPGFKQRLSKMAGRTVDVGDYSAARDKHHNDKRIRELRQWLPSAKLSSVRYRGDGYADVSIRFGAPIIFGQNVRARMVNHELWELYIKGESDPYWGYKGDKSISVFRTRDLKHYVVENRDRQGKVTFRKQWKAEEVQAYRELNRWYFDGFGKMEEEFLRELQ